MKTVNKATGLFAALSAGVIFFACNNSEDYKKDYDKDAKQNAVIEQSSVDTNAMNDGSTAALSPVTSGADSSMEAETSNYASDTAYRYQQNNSEKPSSTKSAIAKRGHKGAVRAAVYRQDFAERIKADRINGNKPATAINSKYGPSFPGGDAQLTKYVENNTEYPQEALDNGVEGTVKVSFAVDEHGNIYSPKIEGQKLGYGIDDEAITIVKNMPKWNPGNVNGKNVKTYYTLPITFMLL